MKKGQEKTKVVFGSKKAYEKPRINSEKILESLAVACGAQNAKASEDVGCHRNFLFT